MRASRKPKLDTIPTDWLVLVARDWLFSRGAGNCNSSVAHVTKVLDSAAARGNEEAAWLQRVMANIPEFGLWSKKNEEAKCVWLMERLKTENGPRAQYYRGVASLFLDGLSLLRQSAENGFIPAMAEFGWRMMDTQPQEALNWLRKAAERNNPEGLFWLGELQVDDVERLKLLRAAAQQGHVEAMQRLGWSFLKSYVPALEAAVISARYVLLTGDFDEDISGIDPLEHADDIQLMFVVGRELEGYDQFWDEGRHLVKNLARCIHVYLTVSHRARCAALQTISALKQHMFPRDMAVLIAQYVYLTREDAIAWFAA